MPACCFGGGSSGSGGSAPAGQRHFVSNNFESFKMDDTILKVCLCGQAAVGKTSINQRFQFGIFHENRRPTIGVDYAVKTLVLDGDVVTLQLWDVAGQQTSREMTGVFYRNAKAIMIVADASRLEESLAEGLTWKKDIDAKYISKLATFKVPVVLAVNKIDMMIDSAKERSDMTARVEQFAKENGFASFHFVSAKSGEHIQTAFEDLVVRTREAIREGHAAHAADE